MPKFVKMTVQVAEALEDKLRTLDHGYQQLVVSIGPLLYLNVNDETRQEFREWARRVSEGLPTEGIPDDVRRALLASLRSRTRKPRAKK